ncbi:MAG: glycosyltransferase, partial [Methanobrevibacter sp.]|nr:glycosyltransferase [Methanobrevibacter sp.]
MQLIFSIIIPVYKTKIEYFIRCLESIKNNNLCNDEFEVIIVNDGMDDFSQYEEIINNVLKSNGINVRVITNDINMNLSYARFRGLKDSHGDYVHFVDSDDEIYPNIYINLKYYLTDNPNFVLFMEKYNMEGVEHVNQEKFFKNLIEDTPIDDLKSKTFFKDDLKKLRGTLSVTAIHSKIFNKKWLLDNIRSWIPNLYVEDVLLSTEIFMKTKKFKVSYNKFYQYYQYLNIKSITSEANDKLFMDALFVYNKAFNMLYREDKWYLRYLIIDFILSFYSYYSNALEDYAPFIKKIFEKYDNINFKFFDKNQYQQFKNNIQLSKLFSPLILTEEELFFSKIIHDTDDETILPSDKLDKEGKIVEKGFVVDFSLFNNKKFRSDQFFLSSVLFLLTKFVYNKKILISRLYADESIDLKKIIFGMNINTDDSVETFLDKVSKQIKKLNEYESYFPTFKNNNDLSLPHFQYYYQSDEKEFKIPKSNFSVIIKDLDELKIKIFYNSSFYSEDFIQLFYDNLLVIIKKFADSENSILKNI